MIISCSIPTPTIQYDILVGEDLLEQAFQFAKRFSDQILVITTDSIAPLLNHIDKLVLPSGEVIKSRAMKEKIENFLINRGWGKKSCLIAIGGGALLDLVGFVAATYCRGIAHLFIPTTLLSMTDAAIGGKTGINVEEAKNWIGAFHHPKKIFIDLKWLKTLPDHDFIYGMVETIKHGLVADVTLFEFLEKEVDHLIQRQLNPLKEMIIRSCLVKKKVIEQDPYEEIGYRQILNFGHTVGHALETLSSYQYSHGQAVAMGIMIEAHIAYQMGYLPLTSFQRIKTLLNRFQFNTAYPKHLPFEMLKRDKKGAYHCVILNEIGSVALCNGNYSLPITQHHLQEAWSKCHIESVTCCR